MFNTIDYIVIGFFALFFILGFRKGFLKTILGPFSLILAIIASMIVQKQTGSLLYSTLVALIGPFIIEWLLSLALKKKSGDDKKAKLSVISRLAGALLNSVWVVVLSAIVIFLISILPSSFEPTAPLKKNVEASQVYKWLKKAMKDKTELKDFDIDRIQNAMNNPAQKAKIEKMKEYQKIMNDDKVQDFVNDPEIQKMLKDKNYVALLKSEKMQEILKDKDLVKQFFDLQKKVMDSTWKDIKPSGHTSTGKSDPHTIELKDGVYTNR
jgi:uncharacterized membrane protein required for colicin V production